MAGETKKALKRRTSEAIRWTADEQQQRAAFVATRRALMPFLVPHRFEGDKTPEALNRSQLGYGVGLNKAYVHEITGHLKGSERTIEDGGLSGFDLITKDFTGTGESWGQFFGTRVLEWALTSLGGFILVDGPASTAETQAEERDKNLRPKAHFIPWSSVWDRVRSRDGYQWIEFVEQSDERKPDGTGEVVKTLLLYELDDKGETWVTRRTDDDEEVTPRMTLGKFTTASGTPTLPIVAVRFGEHAEIADAGAGLTSGLDDIVIDIFNLLSEAREAFRDGAFGYDAYTGDSYDTVLEQMTKGSRLVHLGEDSSNSLERIASDPKEVEAGMGLIESATKAWTLSARRKAMEVVEGSGARSGVSLEAEFRLDLKPLLVEIAAMMESIELQTLRLVAQVMGKEGTALETLSVVYNKDFRPEDEGARIARIASEFLETLPLPAKLIEKLITDWADAHDLTVDFDEEERLEMTDQIAGLAAAKQQQSEDEGQPQGAAPFTV